MEYRKKLSMILSAVLIISSIVLFGVVTIGVFYVFLFSVLSDLAYCIICKVSKKENKTIERIYKSGLIAIALSVIMIGYGYNNIDKLVETDYTIYTDKSIKSDGYKVAYISDLHYGLMMDGEKLKQHCEEIEKHNPDIVILGGNIVDEGTEHDKMYEAFDELSQIKSTYGTYYVYGNHDKSIYSKEPNYTEEELEKAINDKGIKILADDAITINEEITVTGRKDKSFKGNDLRIPIEQLAEDTHIDNGKYNILADHQAGDFEKVDKAGYDAIISGHTHAGQIWPGGLFIKTFLKYTLYYGHEKKNNLDVIVSSGMAGWRIPLRTEGNSEYVIINIKPE